MEGISNIKAAVAAVKELSDTVEKVLADGQVNFRDIVQVPALISEVNSLIASIKGAIAEAQDVDAEEMKELLNEALDLILYVAVKFGVTLESK